MANLYQQQSGQGYTPPQPERHAPPAAPQRKMPVWGWVVIGVLALIVLGSVVGGGGSDNAASESVVQPTSAAPPAAPPSLAAPASAIPVPVKLPQVKGKNGAIVYDELTELGLTNFQFASQDIEDKVVINPANWTVVKIEPGVGETVMSDDTVVVTMTKE